MSAIPTLFADGPQMVERGIDEEDLSSQAPLSRAAKGKAAPKGRAKRGKGTILSSSFTCWRLVPVTHLTLAW